MATDYQRVLNRYRRLPPLMKTYFGEFDALILLDDKYAWDIIVAYLFMQVERAQHSIVYCAMVKKHKANKDVTRSILSNIKMQRKDFRDLYVILGGRMIPSETIELAKKAEDIRDKIIHGNDKEVSVKNKKIAIVSIFDYSHALNEHAFIDFKVRPFGDLTGFNGRAETYPKPTSKWIVRGILSLSKIKMNKNNENQDENNPQQPAPVNPQAQDNPA